MTEFDSHVCGIPCIIRVTDYERYRPAYISGPPENCYPAEGGCGDWEFFRDTAICSVDTAVATEAIAAHSKQGGVV